MLPENKKEAALSEQPDKDSNKNIVADDLDEICRKLQRDTDPTYLKTFTMTELYEEVFESRPSIIEGLLTAGTYILAGAPKLGKSFLVMQLAWHVSTGEAVWDMPVRQGSVLYLALEDDMRRLQDRLYRMFGAEATDKLHFSVYSQSIGWQISIIETAVSVMDSRRQYGNTRCRLLQGFRRSRKLPRRARYAFDGSAVKSAFALLLPKVTKGFL